MIKRNPYKFRGPGTWALAREAYLAGETADSVAARLDVGVWALKRRAHNEGWTRRDHAAAIDAAQVRRVAAPSQPRVTAETGRLETPSPAVDGLPQAGDEEPSADAQPLSGSEVARFALERAVAAMRTGRLQDAALLVRTAESVGRLLAQHGGFADAASEGDDSESVASDELRQLVAEQLERLVAAAARGGAGLEVQPEDGDAAAR